MVRKNLIHIFAILSAVLLAGCGTAPSLSNDTLNAQNNMEDEEDGNVTEGLLDSYSDSISNNSNDVAGTPGSDLDDTTYVMEDNNKSTSSTSEEVWDYVPSESEKVITLPYNSGDEFVLSYTVNIRSSMSETASEIAVADAGEKVTVVMQYSEGWTKVTYKGKEGYVKTEDLK